MNYTEYTGGSGSTVLRSRIEEAQRIIDRLADEDQAEALARIVALDRQVAKVILANMEAEMQSVLTEHYGKGEPLHPDRAYDVLTMKVTREALDMLLERWNAAHVPSADGTRTIRLTASERDGEVTLMYEFVTPGVVKSLARRQPAQEWLPKIPRVQNRRVIYARTTTKGT